eukprot:42457_1
MSTTNTSNQQLELHEIDDILDDIEEKYMSKTGQEDQDDQTKTTNITCICGKNFQKVNGAGHVYGGIYGIDSAVRCDGCGIQCKENDMVYHCEDQSKQHYYDLCVKCYISMSQIEEDKNDQMSIFKALDRMRKRGLTNTKHFTWQLVYKENEIEYKYNKKDEKQERISQLIDEKNKQMCKLGHGEWADDVEEANKCVSCGSKKEIKCCCDCWNYTTFNKGNDNPNDSDFIYCSDCRISNGKKISNHIKVNNLKAAIIRKELFANPCLEMDILCNMQRHAACDWLIKDINKLEVEKRWKWCLLVMDLDFLKCWNTCLGHVKTDGLIQKIGGIMSRNINDINSGKWIDKTNSNNSLLCGFVYRIGGDEFVIAIKCGGHSGAYVCPLGPFYNSMKAEINALGNEENMKDLFSNGNEWKEAKEELKNAKDRDGNPIDMSCVGISTGMYFASYEVKESNWLFIADKIALEHS